MKFSERLKLLRERHNHTQGYVAKYLGVTQVAVSNWERGEKQPSFQVLIDLAALFGVSTDYLLGITTNSERYT